MLAVMSRSTETVSIPAATPEQPHSNGFATTIDNAVAKALEFRGTQTYARDYGITEEALDRYVSGACSLYELETIQYVLSRCQWAMDYVIEKVKARRHS